MKTKKYEEVNYVAMGNKTLKEIKRDFKIQTVFMIILIILALIVCFMGMDLAVDYEALKRHNADLEVTIKLKDEKIEQDKEANDKLHEELENLRAGGTNNE